MSSHFNCDSLNMTSFYVNGKHIYFPTYVGIAAICFSTIPIINLAMPQDDGWRPRQKLDEFIVLYPLADSNNSLSLLCSSRRNRRIAQRWTANKKRNTACSTILSHINQIINITLNCLWLCTTHFSRGLYNKSQENIGPLFTSNQHNIF